MEELVIVLVWWRSCMVQLIELGNSGECGGKIGLA